MAQRRRASKEVTQGIEDQIDKLHVFSAKKRTQEIFVFILLYSLGFTTVFFFKEIFFLLIIGILFMGLAVNSLGVLIHEGLHGLLARDSRINHLISFLVGLPILISATAYQVTHTNHHLELGKKLDYGTYKQHSSSNWLISFAYLLQVSFGSIIYMFLVPLLGFSSARLRSRIFIIIEYLFIVIFFSVFFSSVSVTSILLFWFIPLFIMNVLTNIRGVASHALGDIGDIYLSSRTIATHDLVSFMFLHENYHLEHHLFPRIPSYNLKKTHELVWDRLPRALYSKSYTSFLVQLIQSIIKRDNSPKGVIFPNRSNK